MPLVEKSQALYVVMVKKSTQVQFVFLHQKSCLLLCIVGISILCCIIIRP